MLDAIVLALVVFHFFTQVETAADFSVLSAGIMVLTWGYFWLSVVPNKHLKKTDAWKMFLIILIIVCTTVMATAWQMQVRYQYELHTYIFDHALQLEEAIKMLTGGQNPYTEDYFDTPMALWNDRLNNPALDHLVSLPSHLYLSWPFFTATQMVTDWYDQRLVHLFFLVVGLVMAYRLFEQPMHKRLAMMAVGLNPLFTPFFIGGVDDIIIISLLLIVIWLLKRGIIFWSLNFLALALTTKHTAWLLTPFYFSYLLGIGYLRHRATEKLALFLVLIAVALMPFMWWDMGSFFEDVYSYWAGTLPTSYPIKGMNIGSLLVKYDAIADQNSYFPFGLLQLILLPMMAWMVYRLYKSPSVGWMVIYFSLFLWGFWFLSRIFNPSFMGTLSVFLIIGVLLIREEEGPKIPLSYLA